jgi:hypothetical protein
LEARELGRWADRRRGVGFSFKKWQADSVMKHMDNQEVQAFAAEKHAGKEEVKQYGDGTGEAPKRDFST